MLLLSFLSHLFCAVSFIIRIYRKIYTFGTVCGFRHLLPSGNTSKGEPPGGLSRVITECPGRCCLFVMARPPVFNTVRLQSPLSNLQVDLETHAGHMHPGLCPRPGENAELGSPPLLLTCGPPLLPCPACPLQPC